MHPLFMTRLLTKLNFKYNQNFEKFYEKRLSFNIIYKYSIL